MVEAQETGRWTGRSWMMTESLSRLWQRPSGDAVPSRWTVVSVCLVDSSDLRHSWSQAAGSPGSTEFYITLHYI